MEDLPMGFVDGKKRQRVTADGENNGEGRNMLEKRQDQGGLSLGWREGINITLKSYSKSHIDVVVEEEDGAKTWRFTGFYGEPVEQNRRTSWELLRGLHNGNNLPCFFDHCPLVVNTNRNGVRGNNGQQWRFRFNADWLLNPRCEEQVKKIWTEGSQDVLRRLEELGRKLHDWSKGERKLRDRRFEELNGRLRELGDCDISEAVLEEITGVKIEMNLGADKEEIY
ncbi:reverse transcriptase [Gossypium australe]|uniref:Reverse transcriptase n=1 Tax=Gossypium australe TaxID=47621 RepID=A0A5B6VUI2_9ROSI|nr:reverse transcriptase [Gossypium australe]